MEIFFKPFTMILIFILPFTYGSVTSMPHYALYIITGLFFSILGDYALLFDKWFKLGMLFFLITHIFYLKGIWEIQGAYIGWIIIPVLFVWFWAMANMTPFLPKHLQIPVKIYSLVLCLLIWQSAELFRTVGSLHSQLFFTGILMFAASDWILIIHQNRGSNLANFKMPLYFGGQWLIALSIITDFRIQ